MMTLKETDTQPNIVAARIIAISKRRVIVVTEEDRLLSIPLTKEYRQDKTMLQSLKDILHAGIWIPVNKKLRRLFSYDWLAAPATVETND
jgi:Mg2+/Co2+ transporter CorC